MTILHAVLRLLLRIPYGLLRMATLTWAWCTDKRYAAVYENAIANATKHAEIDANRKARADRRRKRICALIMALGLTMIGLLLADEYLGGGMVWQALAAVTIVTAAGIGKPPARVSSGGTTRPIKSPVNTDSIRQALVSAVPEIARAVKDDPQSVSLVDPPMRDGEGWLARIDLPAGITSDVVVSRSDRVASAFQRSPMAVCAEPDPAHAGRVTLWVGDRAPSEDVEWQLADAEKMDILRPFEIGVDQRGRPFEITLADRNVLIGAMPAYGKTATLRLILLAAALDVRTEIYAFDLKGGTDLLPLDSCAVRVVSGDEDEDVAQLLESLQKVRQEIRDRNTIIRNLPIPERPDGKITTADATRLGWAPIVFAIDEAQIAYENETYGKDIAKLTIDIFKRGRSVGVHMLLATQQFDSESVPTKVSNNASLRMCGRVEGFQASNMILGANAHSSGWSAARLTDKGVMWVKGATVVPQIVRVAKVEADQAWQVARRAARMRSDRPVDVLPETFPMLALAPAPTPAGPELPPKHDLVGRVRHVWPEGEDKLWTETILGLLRETFPGDYADTTVPDLSAKLPGQPRQVKRDGKNRRGYAWEDFAT